MNAGSDALQFTPHPFLIAQKRSVEEPRCCWRKGEPFCVWRFPCNWASSASTRSGGPLNMLEKLRASLRADGVVRHQRNIANLSQHHDARP